MNSTELLKVHADNSDDIAVTRDLTPAYYREGFNRMQTDRALSDFVFSFLSTVAEGFLKSQHSKTVSSLTIRPLFFFKKIPRLF